MLNSFFVGDNLERFATSRFNDPRPPWFYLPIVAGGLMPWTPLMLCGVAPFSHVESLAELVVAILDVAA